MPSRPDVGQLSYTQYSAKVWINTASSILSVIGSGIVIHLTRGKLGEMYHRILRMLSIADLFASMSTLLFPFNKIADEGWPWAIGNDATCIVGGFSLQFFPELAQTMNLYLALFFFMSVNRGWSDAKFRRKVEIPFLLTTGGVSLLFGITAILLGIVHPHPINGTCYLGPPRETCEDYDTECFDSYTKTESYAGWMSGIAFVKNFAIALLSFALTMSVCLQLRRQYRRIARRSLNEEALIQRSRQTVQQLCYFSAVYFNSIIWTAGAFVWIISNPVYVMDHHGDPPLYCFLLLSNIFPPLQGFFNFCIYVRPLLAHRRRQQGYQGGSWWKVLASSIFQGMKEPATAVTATTTIQDPSSSFSLKSALPVPSKISGTENSTFACDESQTHQDPSTARPHPRRTSALVLRNNHLGLQTDVLQIQEEGDGTDFSAGHKDDIESMYDLGIPVLEEGEEEDGSLVSPKSSALKHIDGIEEASPTGKRDEGEEG